MEFGTVGGVQAVESRNTVGTAGSAPISTEIDPESILDSGNHQSVGSTTAGSASAGSTATARCSGTEIVGNPLILFAAGNGQGDTHDGHKDFFHCLVFR